MQYHSLMRLVITSAFVLSCFAQSALVAAELTSQEKAIVAYVDAHQAEFESELEAAVRISSATENLAGVRQMGEFFRERFAAVGFESRFVELPVSTGRAGHLVAEHKGTKGQRVLLIGHLDTVFPVATVRRDGPVLHGSGVADMKGGDMIMLQALRALKAAGALDDTQIVVVMSGDEEAQGTPLEVVRKDMLEAGKRSDVALAFESAVGNTGTIARRGSFSWELEVQGATGHSSGIFSDTMGAGSVYETARILQGFYQELKAMDGLTANAALIAGGVEADLSRTGGTVSGKTNIIPQRTLVRGDLRPISAQQLEEAKARMQAIVAKHLPRTSATLKFNEGYPPMPPSDGSYSLLSKLDRVSQDLGFAPIAAFDPRARGAGDISFVAPPLPGLDGLGLGGKGEHTVNESADLTPASELTKRAALLIYRLTR